LLILAVGSFIAFIIISAIRVSKFYKANPQLRSKLTSHDEAFVDELAQKISKYNR